MLESQFYNNNEYFIVNTYILNKTDQNIQNSLNNFKVADKGVFINSLWSFQ